LLTKLAVDVLYAHLKTYYKRLYHKKSQQELPHKLLKSIIHETLKVVGALVSSNSITKYS